MADEVLMLTEDALASFKGQTDDGSPMSLDSDFLIYFRLLSFEQGAIERLARSDMTLRDDLCDVKSAPGWVLLGPPELVRQQLKDTIDKMFAAIYKHRGIPDPAAPVVK